MNKFSSKHTYSRTLQLTNKKALYKQMSTALNISLWIRITHVLILRSLRNKVLKATTPFEHRIDASDHWKHFYSPHIQLSEPNRFMTHLVTASYTTIRTWIADSFIVVFRRQKKEKKTIILNLKIQVISSKKSHYLPSQLSECNNCCSSYATQKIFPSKSKYWTDW